MDLLSKKVQSRWKQDLHILITAKNTIKVSKSHGPSWETEKKRAPDKEMDLQLRSFIMSSH